MTVNSEPGRPGRHWANNPITARQGQCQPPQLVRFPSSGFYCAPRQPHQSETMHRMATLIGILGAIVGILIGSIATYLTARSNMRRELEYSYDKTLRESRVGHYQALFHLSRCLPRYWRPGEEPTRQELWGFGQEFSDWYFGAEAGGMFLTPAAKRAYMAVQTKLLEVAASPSDSADSQLSDSESEVLRTLGSELRHQLAEDVGSANLPRLRWTRLGPTTMVGAPAPERDRT